MQDEILDALRNPFVVFVSLSAVLSFCMVNSAAIGDAVELEFPVYRMAQYELNGIHYGSKTNKIQYEAVSLDGTALRRCIMAFWKDIATRDIDHILSASVGGLLIVVPQDLDLLSPADRLLFSDMERRLTSTKSTELAVYITPANEKILSVLSDVVSSTGKSTTATQQLLNTVSANTFQFTSTSSVTNAVLQHDPNNIIARLEGSDASASTIFFIAHYDSHSLFPSYSAGSDSNGSGVIMLLQLLSIMRKFYENPVTRPSYNLVFAWTAAGKLNYQGTRAFIESLEKNTAAIIDNDRVELAICIEGVGGPGNLFLHASKQPSEGTAAAQLLKRLKLSAPNDSIELVTKKINLNSPQLNWEHERFNIRRLPAVTISRYSSSDDIRRTSLLDTPSQISLDSLERNIRVVAEAVLGYILALPDTGASSHSYVSSSSSLLAPDAIDRQLLAHFIRQFASKPRPVADSQATKAVSTNLAATVRSLTRIVIRAQSSVEGAVSYLRKRV